MRIQEEIDLYKYSTMRLHSIGKVMYIPESVEELIELIREFRKENRTFHLFSAGSNVVFADRVETSIVNLMKVDKSIVIHENGDIECGCSVRVQSLINQLKEKGFGGIEYLYSLPASIGGIVYMNAGRGKIHNKQISDFLISVSYYDIDSDKIETYFANKNDFAHRLSPFQSMNAIILKCDFRFISQTSETTDSLIKERLATSGKFLDTSNPNCGSVFFKNNPFIMQLFKGVKCGGAMFSKKTRNWISNVNDAKASDIIRLVDRAKLVHRLLFQKYKLEIKILH